VINVAGTICIFLTFAGFAMHLVHPDEAYPRLLNAAGTGGLAVIAAVVGAWAWTAALTPFALFVLSTLYYEFTDWPTPLEMWRSWRYEEAGES
jgi:hypothetical protein